MEFPAIDTTGFDPLPTLTEDELRRAGGIDAIFEKRQPAILREVALSWPLARR